MAIANALAFLLYLCCSVVLIRQFVKRDLNQPAAILPIGLMTTLALIFHAFHLFFVMDAAGGWELSLMTMLSIIAWLMAFMAMIGGFKWQIAHPGIVVYPLVAFILMMVFEVPASSTKRLTDPALEWHILLSLTAYSLLTLAALQSVILALQEKQLHQHHTGGWLRRLPPLQYMEKTLFQLLIAGFVFLSAGLLTGFIFVDNFWAQNLAHKTVFSILAWVIFAVLLWGHYRHGWRAQTAVRWTLAGFLLLLLAYVGSKIVLEFILKVG
ncbi:CcsA-like protein [Methylophaga frappieri]|uniref:CcsA-like protein n=1 Tax=Methylophaga frappieri (strain ATCC BAA-2434 / DSM 25690 / JAM7) TaxID=754477 RepID=I1YGB4_METFJ|nr:cytochrome c biogenesis protein CcsA [Methylophaga frappieri]AFJ01957.1 CcsA-like protein [Methylophaga frappieri]